MWPICFSPKRQPAIVNYPSELRSELAEGGSSGSFFLVPNQGTGNVLEGRLFLNTATAVTVADGTSGNMATVTQFNNVPCL